MFSLQEKIHTVINEAQSLEKVTELLKADGQETDEAKKDKNIANLIKR